MFAIEFAETNIDKILHCDGISVAEVQRLTDLFIKRDYVFVCGYYSSRVPVPEWGIMPKFVFTKTFDHDPEKIKTDWDQIVRL